MQERYLGDIHDYVKYALLRSVSRRLKWRIGLNWYLTDPKLVDPKPTGDGEKRQHLTQGIWSNYDAELVDQLRHYSDPHMRKIATFETGPTLPNDCLYISDYVPTDVISRSQWHRAAMDILSPCDLIFADPDNGFIVPSATGVRRAKYAFFEELADYANRGQAVISIQFARQCDPVERAKRVFAEYRKHVSDRLIPQVLRARVSPNVLLFLTASPDRQQPLVDAINHTVTGLSTKLEWIDQTS